ncbi:UDP-2,4-diacetamido-2,4,6-trideoxy-beta-L-altropyranose hydrolase [Alteromonas pelagimontana]|uniref:UDP-2,4-diacetamido-2,4, 6-trideoxy-beta-L-altropyranose hydrolase n=1 Tax=Alteromonas pelagimontana TaxID=1858656 RepID=A0A6M4MFF3_9ALTE|nr:UDP-2,4-diacetamido-2,4,6-trideoxy-beta-L-altropyranose hydrolase [Alteromonas pelagimontana]QJR81829.1 UDP-2,4-diacetamido-2,4,6-trideoxy-beta-L-altropyranose hydrolase [Alteromonas pelagimontana]
MRPLVFRVEASTQSGLGHLMRCLAIAQAAEDQSIPSIFLLSEEGKVLARARHDWTYDVISVPIFESQHEEGSWIREILNAVNASALIVDGYSFTSELLVPIRNCETSVVVLDDGSNALTAFADIVINPATREYDELYLQSQASLRLCTGDKYRLLRREFQVLSLPSIEARHGIAVNLGGSDPMSLTLPVLQLLQQTLPEVPVRVVTGAGYRNLPALERFIAQSPLAVQHIHNCQNMADVWSHARVAISAAGGSQFELAVCQTPSLLLMVAENQRGATNLARSQGWCEFFDCTTEFPEPRLSSALTELFFNEHRLKEMSAKASKLHDALGAIRVLEVISEAL